MPRNGSGQYFPPNNTWNPSVNGVGATAADWQSLLDDLTAAITGSVSADGQTPMTGNLNMGSNRIVSLASAIALTDAAAAGDIQKGSWLRADPAMFYNGSITASAASSNLTIALKTAAGTDPSATDPVYVAFRSASPGTGTVTVRAVTSALSIVVPSGATLGQSNGVAARLWVSLMDNAGTVEMAVMNTQLGGGKIAVVNEGNTMTTAALSVASDNAGAWYSTSARSGLAFRLAGYVENTQAAAGTWATTPSTIQTMGPGVRKPGDILQRQFNFVGTVLTDTTQIPADNTIPQISEGAQYMSQAITPSSAINTIRVEAQWIGSNNAAAGTVLTAALFQDLGANALRASFSSSPAGAYVMTLRLMHEAQALTTSSTAFTVRAGANAVGTTTFNGSGGGQYMGGVADSYLHVSEIMA